MRRNAEKAADYAHRHHVPKWYSDARDLINDPEVNAVYIATPPNTHAQYAIQAMQAGKAAYVEKPMAKNYAECLKMVQVAKETGMPLFTAYYRRALPKFLKAKEIVDSGALGKILTVNLQLYKEAMEKDQPIESMHWHVFPEIAGAGHFYDLASHQLDFLDFVFGPVKSVSGQATNRASYYPAEDTVSASFRFESGIIGSGSWSFVAEKTTERDIMEIIGTAGKLSFPCFATEGLSFENPDGKLDFPFERPDHVAGGLIQLVINELRGVGKCPSTGISGARTSWVLEEIIKGYYQ